MVQDSFITVVDHFDHEVTIGMRWLPSATPEELMTSLIQAYGEAAERLAKKLGIETASIPGSNIEKDEP